MPDENADVGQMGLLEACEAWVQVCDRREAILMHIYRITGKTPDEVMEGMRALLGPRT